MVVVEDRVGRTEVLPRLARCSAQVRALDAEQVRHPLTRSVVAGEEPPSHGVDRLEDGRTVRPRRLGVADLLDRIMLATNRGVFRSEVSIARGHGHRGNEVVAEGRAVDFLDREVDVLRIHGEDLIPHERERDAFRGLGARVRVTREVDRPADRALHVGGHCDREPGQSQASEKDDESGAKRSAVHFGLLLRAKS